MTDEIPQAAKDYARKLILAETEGALSAVTALARLAHENGLVPQERPLAAALTALDTVTGAMTREAYAEWIEFELAKHGYAVVKVATCEERLIEARELCSMFSDGICEAAGWRRGEYDEQPEMIAMLAALKARDGVV